MPDAPARIMISAGEPSGDLHGAALVREAARTTPSMRFHGLGGDLMAAAGVDLKAHLRDTAVMGLTEVLGSLPRILRVRSGLCRLIESDPPDCLVLIDSPDLNFRLARSARRAGVPVVYYVCPQIWAWRERRLAFLRDFVSRRAVILPFEEGFYRERGVPCDPVGHPLFDELPAGGFDRARVLSDLDLPSGAPILAVLPGSRRKVAARLLGPMLGAVGLLLAEFPGLVAVVPRSPAVPPEMIDAAADRAGPGVRAALRVFPGRSQEILSVCRAALLASGTSTVEGAMLGAPMVVTYRTSALSWLLAKLLVKTPFVALANLVAGREVVKELLQDRGGPEALAGALAPLLRGGPEREAMIADLRAVSAALGGPGASRRVLEIIREEVAAARARAEARGRADSARDSAPEAAPDGPGDPAGGDALQASAVSASAVSASAIPAGAPSGRAFPVGAR